MQTRYPCPVCLGVKMEKVTLSGGDPLVLDHCARCGGVWFEKGEVQRLRKTDAALLWREVVQRDGIHAMQCHSCRTHVARNEPACLACGWKVVLDCPVCDRPLRVADQDGMRIDYCTHCQGAWFDHDELTGIWKLQVDVLVKRRGRRLVDDAGDVVLLDVLLYDPFVMYYGIHAAGHVAGAAAETIAASGSLEVVGEVAGAAGEIASSLFETIAEIIAGIFG
ncbi:MAG: zf-TFIIB domain-containing protein [Gemmatimonadota bacterium]